MGFKSSMIRTFLLIISLNFFASSLFALPFNDDMVDGQLKTGQIMRSKPAGSIAVGTLDQQMTREEAEAKKNPVAKTDESIALGKRLFAANCNACHGTPSRTDYKPAVAGSFMGAPNLADPGYHDRTDGQMFRTVHFGNVIMPRVGWKLSHKETWDIVNYIRSTQE